MIKNLDQLKSIDSGRSTEATQTIYVSLGTCGLAAGTTPVLEAIQDAAEAAGNGSQIIEVGCMGACHSEPSILVENHQTGTSYLYGPVTPEQAPMLVNHLESTPAPGLPLVDQTLYIPETEEGTPDADQYRIVLRNTGRINPEKIEEYIANDGYVALHKALQMQPQEVIDIITTSGLRGRGGGGFPTGKKWSFAAAQSSDRKYVICNADEGDPGAFMDRAVLEGDPHSVLEAMTIAGYAIGANQGVIYIRAEYPLAIQRLKTAINQAREQGLLGEDLFGSGFNFDIRIKYGAGAFVCGEETALIHSIEGQRGEPTFKPPFPAIEGLWKKPTIVNNVETYANICAIIRKGADWFRAIGTEDAPGTKVFALAGKIKRVGLIEVPMGTPLRKIIYNIGGGIREDREFKAVQTGGPSGGCITADQLDTPIEYQTLIKLGSMMGSGGMIVMDQDDCMVNVAKFFLEFTLEESCGKCTPCRIGNTRLHEMLTAICDGHATMETLDKLKFLGQAIKDAALCGLGQTSPNPVLSTIKQFEAEYFAHINDQQCPAGVCTSLIQFTINNRCVGCTLCARNCPVECIDGIRKGKHVIDQERCIKCGVCYEQCKFHAIDKK